MSKDKQFGCSAITRPVVCKYLSNVCCLQCSEKEKCTIEILKDKDIKIRVLPCTKDHFEKLEQCEFSC